MFDWIFIKLADNHDRHKLSANIEFGRDWTAGFGITRP